MSNNYPDKRWRIVDDSDGTTFATRDAAARAERVRVLAHKRISVDVVGRLIDKARHIAHMRSGSDDSITLADLRKLAEEVAR